MTSGKNIQDLSKTIQEITQVFYQEIDDPKIPNALFQKKNIVL
jgi:hypothetical protein